jgi:hypothetical protein
MYFLDYYMHPLLVGNNQPVLDLAGIHMNSDPGLNRIVGLIS